VTSTSTLVLKFIVGPIIQISTLNGITTIKHNIPIAIPDSCAVITETELRCTSAIITVEAL
jgi:hypothetical protein